MFLLLVLAVIYIGCKKTDLSSGGSIIAINMVIPPDSIKLNPYGFAPLSALVNFTSPVAGKTVIIVKGKHGAATDIVHVFNDNGSSHSIPVIGLYADFYNTALIRIINNSGDTLAKSTINIQTGDLPPNLPTSIVTDVLANNEVQEGLYLVSNYSASNPQIPLMIDDYSDLRWVLDYRTSPDLMMLSYQCGIKRLRNGDFYFGDNSGNKIYEIDLLGKILNTWDLNPTGYSFHHDIEEKPDGNFIASVTKSGSLHTNGTPTIEDYIVEIDRGTGSIKTVWDLKESLDEYRTTLTTDPNDWIHVNSVLYDTIDNTIIISGRTQGVAKLTYDNRVKWILGAHKGWTTNRREEDLNAFLLTPLAADGSRITDTAILNGYINHPDFEWCWYQHSVIFLPNGDLMLFDDGSTRNYIDAAPKYSRAVEYKIDENALTIQQKWQYGKERGLETYSSIVSSVQYLPNTNHVLFCPGYQVQNTNGLGGKIVEVDYATGLEVSQISITSANGWGFHRTKRMTAYPE